MDPVSPILPPQAPQMGLVPKSSNSKRIGGYPEPNEWNTPEQSGSRAYPSDRQRRKQSQDMRTVPYSPGNHRPAYVEDYSDEEDDPRMYRRRTTTRRHQRPPASYDNYADANSRYGPLPGRGSVDSYRGYPETPGKANYETHFTYGSEDEYNRRRPAVGGGRGPPRRPPSAEAVMRLPWAIWMGSNAKNHFVAFVGEFVGTTMFLFFAFSGTQVANIGSGAAEDDKTTTGEATGFSPIVLLYIALVFAFSLMVNVWVFFRISGGLFNPAVTLAMLLCKALSPIRSFLLLAAQIAGSIFASFLVSVLFPTQFNVRTTLSTGTSLAQGVLIEAVLTAELVFTIFMLAKEKHKATFIAPVGIGLALFIAELVGVYYTGGSLNPARSFGPCVVTGVFDVEHWIYWVGPAAGAVIAVVFYKFIKILEYEVANPGQDDDDKDQEIKEKEVDVEAGRRGLA
ncbi:aquaporin-like protein [Pyrenochaeta sp. DS3sAY3a]|nr:aquaporin-like protein [Pyrenochaeta sp. DS3sAY3a]